MAERRHIQRNAREREFRIFTGLHASGLQSPGSVVPARTKRHPYRPRKRRSEEHHKRNAVKNFILFLQVVEQCQENGDEEQERTVPAFLPTWRKQHCDALHHLSQSSWREDCDAKKLLGGDKEVDADVDVGYVRPDQECLWNPYVVWAKV